jgi:hypothetical protein
MTEPLDRLAEPRPKPTAPAPAPTEPATARALWPTFMRRTLAEESLRQEPMRAAE